MSNGHGTCLKCRGDVQVFGSRWCKGCWYPGIDDDYQRYRDLREEGFSRYQAAVMSGMRDPDEARED